MEIDRKKLAALEAILFTTDEPLELKIIQKRMKIRERELLELIKNLKEKYNSEEHGILLSEIGGYKLIVKPEFQENVSDLTPHADMSRGLLRILSIIMYHEPIKQSDIVKIIGNRTYEYTKELERRGFIKWEKQGRTKVLRLTPAFDEYFGVPREKIKEQLKKGALTEDNLKPKQ